MIDLSSESYDTGGERALASDRLPDKGKEGLDSGCPGHRRRGDLFGSTSVPPDIIQTLTHGRRA